MVQRVPELVWWREKETGWSREQTAEKRPKRDRPEPGAEKRRQRERDRSIVMDGGIASPERESVAKERESR
jgi:hypothetical protein